MSYTISSEGEKDRGGYATRADAIAAVIRSAPLTSLRANVDFEGSFTPDTESCEVRVYDRSGAQRVWTIRKEASDPDIMTRIRELELRLKNQESEFRALKADKEERHEKKKKRKS